MSLELLERAREERVQWDEVRARRNLDRLLREARAERLAHARRRAAALALGAAAVVALGIGIGVAMLRSPEVDEIATDGGELAPVEPSPGDVPLVHQPELAAREPSPETHAEAPAGRTVSLPDGSVATLGEGAAIEVGAEHGGVLRIVQREGEVDYDVARRPERTFEVLARDVRVRVVGTRFRVSIDGEHVHVAVQRGRVAVSVQADASAALLSAGDEWHSDATSAPRTPETPDDGRRERGARQDALGRVEDAPVDAPGTATQESAARAEAEPADIESLLARARTARGEGRLDEAATLLEQASALGGARSAYAAYVLGRVHTQRGDLDAAGAAFERALALAPHGTNAEDARASAARAWRASDRARSRAHAETYLTDHPDGVHAAEMRSLIE